MRKILEELYYGNIRPCEGEFPKEEEYRVATNQVVAIESALMERLDDVSQELYRQLTFALIACDSLEAARIYADGFRTKILSLRIIRMTEQVVGADTEKFSQLFYAFNIRLTLT